MTPFMISSQVNDLVIESPKAERFRMGVDLILEQREKPFMSAALFHQYITTALIVFIIPLRASEQFAGKPAILLMDNCSLTRNARLVRL
jgi:hypothetical protein